MLLLVTAARKLEPAKPINIDDTSVDPLEHGDEWEAEINRRIAEAEAGKGKWVSLEEVEAKIRAKYGWE